MAQGFVWVLIFALIRSSRDLKSGVPHLGNQAFSKPNWKQSNQRTSFLLSNVKHMLLFFLYFQNNASSINQFIGMQRSSSECGKSQDNELVTGTFFFLLPSSCSSCKMPHSPCFAHKAPVMQAIVGVASRNI